ncbi:MAG: aldehyde ferredoxin oxidoreductase C-terminal domain-containing protein, partial [Gemmatimonadetes bacterium]|nr:aldehyde ferredoxin oxidoreductase C-terminal domain-containing protein [Gemmatimonadota bacterium]
AAPGRLDASHKPEYETLCMAGTNCLNNDLDSIIRLNDICNAQGLDTISMGAIIAFAIECYENEIITAEDTGGLELRWGNGEAIAALAAGIAARAGIGELLADGVMRASQRLGRGSAAFAVHSHGQELPAHDPKFAPALAVIYRMDAAPGRHTEGGAGWRMGDGFMTDTRKSKYDPEGFGELHRRGMAIVHAVSSAGICLFAYGSYPIRFFTDFLGAVTGREHTLDECVLIGERIATVRHLFNLREGLNPLHFEMNPRAIGDPPPARGKHTGVTVDDQALVRDYLRHMDWDPETTEPSPRKLRALGLSGLVARYGA